VGLKDRLIQQAVDGTGLDRPFLLNGAPTSGASGSFVSKALPGSLLIDLAGAKLYIATVATGSTVTWTVVGSQV
jgi:hypothetical protein